LVFVCETRLGEGRGPLWADKLWLPYLARI